MGAEAGLGSKRQPRGLGLLDLVWMAAAFGVARLALGAAVHAGEAEVLAPLALFVPVLVGGWRARLGPRPWEVRLPGRTDVRWILRLLLACALYGEALRWIGHPTGWPILAARPWSWGTWAQGLVLGGLAQAGYRGVLQRGLEPRLGVAWAGAAASCAAILDPVTVQPWLPGGQGRVPAHLLAACAPMVGPALAGGWLYAREGGLVPVLVFQGLWFTGLSVTGAWPAAAPWILVLGGLLVTAELLATLDRGR